MSRKPPTATRGRVIEKCYKLLAFVSTGRKFTVSDVAEHLECGWIAASNHVNALSLYFPIAEMEERTRRYDGTFKAAVFQMIKDD